MPRCVRYGEGSDSKGGSPGLQTFHRWEGSFMCSMAISGPVNSGQAGPDREGGVGIEVQYQPGLRPCGGAGDAAPDESAERISVAGVAE